MEWLLSPFILIVIAYVLLITVWFIRKLNRDRVVATEHGADGHVDAIQFFWRPG